MHIPPYHRKRSWQIFAIGLFLGAIIAYFIFILMYGKLYGNLLTDVTKLEAEIKDLERQNDILLEDKEQLQQEQIFTIQEIEVHFTNQKDFRFDRLTIHQLNALIKEELQDIIGKDVDSIANNTELITNLIEKSIFEIDDLTYTFSIKKIVITETVSLDLHVTFAP